MLNNLYLVLSKQPEQMSLDDYSEWYDSHIRKNILAVPGFLRANRYQLIPGADEPGNFSHLSLYEYEGEQQAWFTEMRSRIDSGAIPLPEWFDQISFGSWDCSPIDERVEHVRPGPRPEKDAIYNLYLVFSSPPPDFSWDDYDAWYHDHVREHILPVPGFISATRYELTPGPDDPGTFRHLSLYEYEGKIDTWMADLVSRMQTGVIELPEWFPQIKFGSWDCTPLSGRLVPMQGASASA